MTKQTKKSLKVSVSLLEENRKHIFSLKEKVNSLISDFYKEEYHISSTSLVTLMEIFFSVSVAIERIDEILEQAKFANASEVNLAAEEVLLLSTLMRGALEASSLKLGNNISLVEN